VSEDLARRFEVSNLDAKCEDPEARPFAPSFLAEIELRRAELLAAALTIWRYGRQNVASLTRGETLGSFETWCDWVRDPLLTLGCADPVGQIGSIKASDPRRMRIADLFDTWYRWHGEKPVKATDLAELVIKIIDPQGRGRQFVASSLSGLNGTRAGGFVLTRQPAEGKWGAATYALQRTSNAPPGGAEHRDHRDHRASEPPMPPMPPMPDATEDAEKFSSGSTTAPHSDDRDGANTVTADPEPWGEDL
jgi:hypothetical protein